MGKGPKKSDYQPSEADRTSAAISLQRYNDFKTKYQPLLTEMRDKAAATGLIKVARGRANADTMQALEGQTPTLRSATTVDDTTGETGRALGSQLEKATAQGMEARNEMGAGVLAAANQQSATGQDGLRAVARINTSDALHRADRKQRERDAKWNLATTLGGAVLQTGMANIGSGGKFFTPNANAEVDEDGNSTGFIKPSSLRARTKIGIGRIT